jgi:hypothetical protein
MTTNPEIIILFLGPTIGFLIFLAGVTTMDGIFVRPDTENNKVFTMDGFKDFLKAPFETGTNKFKVLWGITPGVSLKSRLKMLQLNWVAMTGLGTAISTGLVAAAPTLLSIFK